MKKNNKKLVISMVVVLAVVLGLVGFYAMSRGNKVTSIVMLDVNPSIELKVDADEDVVEVNALNADAEKVLEGMKLKGMDVDTAVNAIVGSLLKNGYIDEVANSILVTVEDSNTVRGEKLQAELTEEINEILGAMSVNAAVLAQHIDADDVYELANEYGISKGKAALIEGILEVNDTYNEKELVQLSVNELNLILSNPKNEVKDVVSSGNANENAYIGREEAKKIAFAHANVAESNVRDLEVDFDYEYGKMVYEVDFDSAEYEYEYTIDAETGEVLHSHREYEDDYKAAATNGNTDSTTTNNTATDIGKEKAKSVALAHAGFTESQVTLLKVERDIDDGRIEYSVEFTVNKKEYDYEIDGTTGKILDYDVEVADND